MRDRSIDVAKGLAIIAIVLGHVLRGLVSSGLIDANSTAFQHTDRLLYMAHLSVFALLSGLFVQQGLAKSGRADYLRSRVGLFLYLYVLWELLQGFSALVLSPEGKTVGTVLSLWRPDSQMWFFPWLIVVTVAVAFFPPWGRPRYRAALACVVIVAVGIARWGQLGTIAFTQGLSLGMFFFAGAAMGSARYQRWVAARISIPVAIAAGALYVVLTVQFDAVPPTSLGDGWSFSGTALGVVSSFSAVAAVAVAAKMLSRVDRLAQVLAYVGRHSLEVFVAHVFAINAVRVVLERAGFDSVALQVALGTVGGVVFPLLLGWVVARFRIPWVFDAPRVIVGAPRTAKTH
ncbi:acyltransferase family protein [Rhodococcoides fascians]|uniref:acyltransferase family protein n=1 Tax=Rhodococcoides fascians TaxID=1828 RepID=UPI0005614D0E|nr:acyltransferase [Rhodococcus fascians]